MVSRVVRRLAASLAVVGILAVGAPTAASAGYYDPMPGTVVAVAVAPVCATKSGPHTYGEISVYVRYAGLSTATSYQAQIAQYTTSGGLNDVVPGATMPERKNLGEDGSTATPKADGSLVFNHSRLATSTHTLGVPEGSVQWIAGATYHLVLVPLDPVVGYGILTTLTLPDCVNNDPNLGNYVTAVYSDLFSRAPDAEGLAVWTSRLQSGTPYGDVANGITYSAEYRTGMIRDAYRTYLDREAEAAGLAGWLGAMQAGMHIEQMQGGFISSPEYYKLGGGTDTGWITRLYQKVLHRTPAHSEVDYWLARLAAGATRYDVAMGFLYSTEHLTEVVDGYYQLLLHRSIDPSGRQTWVTKIQTGSRDEQIIASIVSSAEYRNNVPGGTTPANPGDTKNCGDFSTWSQAQEWFDLYYPHYGDVASLDADDNGIACESLPGAP